MEKADEWSRQKKGWNRRKNGAEEVDTKLTIIFFVNLKIAALLIGFLVAKPW